MLLEVQVVQQLERFPAAAASELVLQARVDPPRADAASELVPQEAARVDPPRADAASELVLQEAAEAALKLAVVVILPQSQAHQASASGQDACNRG